MTTQVGEVDFSGVGDKLFLEVGVFADAERDVSARAESKLDAVDVVALGAVYVVVERRGALGSLGLHDGDTALLDHVGAVEAAHVNGPARWRVVERVRGLREGLPVAEERGVATVASNQVVSYHDKADAGGADVLLGSGVDDSVLAPVNGLGHEVGGHVADEGLALGHLVEGEIE